jgi:hypothetical protein
MDYKRPFYRSVFPDNRFFVRNWILSSTLFRKVPRKKQPKETPIALQSDFFFCSQEDASIT